MAKSKSKHAYRRKRGGRVSKKGKRLHKGGGLFDFFLPSFGGGDDTAPTNKRMSLSHWAPWRPTGTGVYKGEFKKHGEEYLPDGQGSWETDAGDGPSFHVEGKWEKGLPVDVKINMTDANGNDMHPDKEYLHWEKSDYNPETSAYATSIKYGASEENAKKTERMQAIGKAKSNKKSPDISGNDRMSIASDRSSVSSRSSLGSMYGGTRKTKCVKRDTKKYTQKKRISPPYAANDCKNKRKKGNNGKFWKSVKMSNGVYRWQPVVK
tara:strand:+ start:540 stop:1334 length:795 start_codon:yes stop_codon:yes gene_type:complete